jgi:hypothetical protein
LPAIPPEKIRSPPHSRTNHQFSIPFKDIYKVMSFQISRLGVAMVLRKQLLNLLEKNCVDWENQGIFTTYSMIGIDGSCMPILIVRQDTAIAEGYIFLWESGEMELLALQCHSDKQLFWNYYELMGDEDLGLLLENYLDAIKPNSKLNGASRIIGWVGDPSYLFD